MPGQLSVSLFLRKDTPPPRPKRKEHPERDPLDSPTPPAQLPKRLKPCLTDQQKLKNDLDWTIGDLLPPIYP
jgi:hypothetical protein